MHAVEYLRLLFPPCGFPLLLLLISLPAVDQRARISPDVDKQQWVVIVIVIVGLSARYAKGLGGRTPNDAVYCK